MPIYDLLDIPQTELVPGYHVRFVHTDNMTFAYWIIDRDATLPEHSHPHEQVANMIAGEFELTVDGVPHLLKPGMVFVIPGNVRHTGKALSDCQIIDVFYPAREDYRNK